MNGQSCGGNHIKKVDVEKIFQIFKFFFSFFDGAELFVWFAKIILNQNYGYGI